jgi:general secretion pathway protein B
VSFILDALRKSEHARQSLGNAAIAELPIGRRERGQPWWVIAIAILLVVNLGVLLVVALKDPKSETTKATPVAAVAPQSNTGAPANTPPPVATQSKSDTRPLSEEAAPPQIRYDTVDRSEVPRLDPANDGPALVKRANERPATTTSSPTADGLPELRIDMHVYASQRADRFVFINMHKYAEGQTLAEGPYLEEITRDGVVLSYKGQLLRLQRP